MNTNRSGGKVMHRLCGRFHRCAGLDGPFEFGYERRTTIAIAKVGGMDIKGDVRLFATFQEVRIT